MKMLLPMMLILLTSGEAWTSSLFPKEEEANELAEWKQRAQDIAQEELTQWKPNLADCPRGQCEYLPDYPTEAIQLVMDKSPAIAKLFQPTDAEEEEVLPRTGDFGEKSMCETEEQIVYPQYWKDTNNEMRIVINLPNGLTQRVKTYRCRRGGERCLYSDRLGLETYCKQKTIVQKLLTVSSDGQDVEMGEFEVPSACVCKIKVRKHRRHSRP